MPLPWVSTWIACPVHMAEPMVWVATMGIHFTPGVIDDDLAEEDPNLIVHGQVLPLAIRKPTSKTMARMPGGIRLL